MLSDVVLRHGQRVSGSTALMTLTSGLFPVSVELTAAPTLPLETDYPADASFTDQFHLITRPLVEVCTFDL